MSELGPLQFEVNPGGTAIAKDGVCVATAHATAAITRKELPHVEYARLFAAAPDLLAVAKRMLNHPLIRLTGDVEPDLIAAIAKATGK